MAFAIEPSDLSGSSSSEPQERLPGDPGSPRAAEAGGGPGQPVSSVEQWPLQFLVFERRGETVSIGIKLQGN